MNTDFAHNSRTPPGAASITACLLASLLIHFSAPPAARSADDSEKIRQLEQRVAELEAGKNREDRLAELRAKNKQRASERARQDLGAYSREQLQEIESLYQVANKNWRTAEAKDSLKKLLEKYDHANRTGCATLYMGQMSEGEDREDYLKRAIEKFGDCFYFDGCQVGGYARYILGVERFLAGQKDEAMKLFDEIRKSYSEAIQHNGKPMSEAVDQFLESQKEKVGGK